MTLMVVRSSHIGFLVEQGRRRAAHLATHSDLLYSELSALDDSQSARIRHSDPRRHAMAMWHQEATHRQNPQERSLASVLQPNHGDVHLGCPRRREQLAFPSQVIVARDAAFPCRRIRARREASDGASGQQACVRGHGEKADR